MSNLKVSIYLCVSMYKTTTKNQIFIVSLAKINLWIVLAFFFVFSLPFLFSNLDLAFSTKFYNFTILGKKHGIKQLETGDLKYKYAALVENASLF